MRRPLLILLSLVAIIATAFVIVFFNTQDPPVLKLPSDATLAFVGMSHGTKVPLAELDEDTAVDLDGHAWEHQRDWPLSGWQERFHNAMPKPLSDRLPAKWRPRGSYGEAIMPYAEAMQWQLSGPFDFRAWRLTWVDKNGYEADGHATMFYDPSGGYPILFNGSLPPCYSTEVIARLRQRGRTGDLIAEVRMKNPCLLPLPTTPSATLPASITQDGITVTLHSLTVNPKVTHPRRTTVRLTVTPDGTLDRWRPSLQFSDARRTPVTLGGSTSKREGNNYAYSTPASLWSDGPWVVRVSLWPYENWEAPVSDVLHFKRVELPFATHDSKTEIAGQSGTLEGSHVALTYVEYTTEHEGTWHFTFDRARLPHTSEFRIRVTDDVGREWDMTAHGGSADGPTRCQSEHWLIPPKGPAAKFVDISMTIDKSKTYEFQVTPEFKPATPP